MLSSLRIQILLIAMVPVFLIDLILTSNHIRQSFVQQEQLLKKQGELIAQQVAYSSEFNILSGNLTQLQTTLDKLVNKSNLTYLVIYDTEGNVLAQSSSPEFKPTESIDYSFYRHSISTENLDIDDIFTADSVDQENTLLLGYVNIYLSKQELIHNKGKIIRSGLFFFLVMLVLSAILTLLISQQLIKPIHSLLIYLKKIESGHLGETINRIENNEIGDLQKGFNSMSQSLLANRMQLDQKIKNATLDLMNAITNLEYNNRELINARDNAERADKIKTRFLANMSHEIRTPINGITGFLRLLMHTGLNRDQMRYAEIIQGSCQDLNQIVNEILDFSKIESGKIEINNETFDFHSLLETTRNGFFASINEKSIDLYLNIYADTPRYLSTDALKLKQVLINLIGNAIKFTEKGYVSIRVYPEEQSFNKNLVCIQIDDTGIGISETDQKDLFQAFRQIESDANRRYSGTGLGLVISKNLTHLMGGDIELSSEPGKGSSFKLILPFLPEPAEELEELPFEDRNCLIITANEIAARELTSIYTRLGMLCETLITEESHPSSFYQDQLNRNLAHLDYLVFDARRPTYPAKQLLGKKDSLNCEYIVMHYDQSLIDRSLYPGFRVISIINSSDTIKQILLNNLSDEELVVTEVKTVSVGHQKHLLLVDDNRINLALAGEMARSWGHTTDEAENAQDALSLFKQNQYDMIMLDIQMPEIDGIELMQQMRANNPELTTPIFAITADAFGDNQQKLLKLGFDGYISKPIDEAKLRAILENRDYSKPEIEDEVPESYDVAIDLKLTRALTANNSEIFSTSLRMFQDEIPDYQQSLNNFVENMNFSSLSTLLHKLEGVTCYIGLPVLKKQLQQFHSETDLQSEDIHELIKQMITELSRISSAIKELKNSAETSD